MWNEVLGATGFGLLWAVMTIGIYITYRILDVADLTVEGSITMGAAVCAVSITAGVNPYLSLILAFGAGMAAGLCTGLLHTLLKIPPLLSGILTMIAAWSVNLRIMGKANVSLLKMPTVFSPLTEAFGMTKTVATIAVGAGMAVLLIFFCYWFFGTEVGCAIRATGSNPNMARAQGINTNRMKIIGLVLANGLVAVSGALIAQSQSFADIQMGTGSIVIGLASLIIGEVLFGKSNFFKRLISLVLGAITYRLIIAAVLRFGMNANDLKLFTAITVALALSLPVIKEKLRACRKGKQSHAER